MKELATTRGGGRRAGGDRRRCWPSPRHPPGHPMGWHWPRRDGATASEGSPIACRRSSTVHGTAVGVVTYARARQWRTMPTRRGRCWARDRPRSSCNRKASRHGDPRAAAATVRRGIDAIIGATARRNVTLANKTGTTSGRDGAAARTFLRGGAGRQPDPATARGDDIVMRRDLQRSTSGGRSHPQTALQPRPT
jgi:hypothetical protein